MKAKKIKSIALFIVVIFAGAVTGNVLTSSLAQDSQAQTVVSCANETCDGYDGCEDQETQSCHVHDNSCTSGCCYIDPDMCEDNDDED